MSSPVVRFWKLIVLGLAAAGLIAVHAAPASAVVCKRTLTPDVGGGYQKLVAVSVTPSGNAWAVGEYSNLAATMTRTLIEHWNGRAWKVQTSPRLKPRNTPFAELSGVAATSSRNVWAVGSYGNGPNQSLVEHWNGTAWTREALPLPRGTFYSQLLGVAATSARDAWAVGYDLRGALIFHWNGHAWKLQPSPKLGPSQLLSVTAISSHNAWAVGYRGTQGTSNPEQTLIEHWNGTAWKVQRSPNPAVPGQEDTIQLIGVAASSATNVWAVGAEIYNLGDSANSQGLVERWNGSAWQMQANLSVSNQPIGVAATSPTDVWGVGEGLIERWNGSAWQALPNPNGWLFAVTATSSTNVWAVGARFPSAAGPAHTLALHCD